MKFFRPKTIALALAAFPLVVVANPQDGKVVAGNAVIRQESATKVGITQTTDKAIIDWKSYSIGASEQVQYYQPSAASVSLNRVTGQDPSQILGRLTANGQVFLVNPNGIYFGRNAQIDVAGLVASTHNIRNEDFMAGRYKFDIPGKPGAAVINEGMIRIDDTGVAAFVAPSVANRGVVVARLGKVALASANGFTLDFTGDQLLTFLVKDEVAQTAFDIEGNRLTSFVENSGKIEAQGGYVLLTARAAENAIHSVINQSGSIEATSVGQQNGEIVLSGGAHGVVANSGTLDASGKAAGETGGRVEITGEKIGLFDGTRIDVSGDQGGGKAIVGGDYLGGKASDATMAAFGIQRESHPIQTATYTNMASNAFIQADALTSGKGGKVVLWSDNRTLAYGTISARGGKNAGDGGFVEVSGGNTLNISGLNVKANAFNGKSGTVLFDPSSIHIVTAAAAQSSGSLYDFTASNDSNISSAAIADILNSGTNVTLRTNTSSGKGEIFLDDSIQKSSGGDATLSLLANSSVYMNNGKTIRSTNGKLNVVIDSDTDNTNGGIVQIRNIGGSSFVISTNGGNVDVRAWDTILEGRAIESIGGDITIRTIDRPATWITIGPSGSDFYTLDALTGKVILNSKYGSNGGDFIEFHNHAVRAKNIQINSSEMRNSSPGYSYSSSDYSYSLPAYNADDSNPELAYVNISVSGGASTTGLDGQIVDSALLASEVDERTQALAKETHN
ncbi:MAG: filamentous hemagglutinin N-terminal domain-containing protein [Rhodocyclaceae bacterium]|nr:filamentous hemagglutinin N-terminal domain-containing protein [Rhodocyclaceae bacterium]